MLATERNIQPVDPEANIETLNPNEDLAENLLESSLGFIAGGAPIPNTLGAPRLRNPKPHNKLSTDDRSPSGERNV